MKLTAYLLIPAALSVILSGCGSKESSTTNTNTTNTTNTGNLSPNQQPGSTSPADSLMKLLSQPPKTDSLSQKKTTDTAVQEKKPINPVERIKDYLKEEFKNEYKKLSLEDRVFTYDTYDLMNDGRVEYFILLRGSHFTSGGGCTVYILNPDFTYNTKMFEVQLPIYASLSNMTNKWKNLYVKSGKGYHKLVYSTTQYPVYPAREPDFDITTDNNKAEVLSEKSSKRATF